MNIKGKHILDEKVENIWPMLQDQAVLARIAPGISRIEKVSEDSFKAISDISIGPVRGSFEGALSLTDKVEYEQMTLVLEQKSKIGNAKASIVMNLTSQEENKTLISYAGKANVSGRLATMGQRILGGVISTLSKQVFKELETIVEERKAKLSATDLTSEPISESSHLASTDVQVPAAAIMANEEINNDQPDAIASSNNKSFIQSIIDKILSIWR